MSSCPTRPAHVNTPTSHSPVTFTPFTMENTPTKTTLTKGRIETAPKYALDLNTYYWTPECVPRDRNLEDNVIALLEIEAARGMFSRKQGTKNKVWALVDFKVMFDRDGKLRARHNRHGHALLDMSGNSLWTTTAGNDKRIHLNGGDATIPDGPYSTHTIVDADGFGTWWQNLSGSGYRLPRYDQREPEAL